MLTRNKPLTRTPMRRKQPKRPAVADRSVEFASHKPSTSRAVQARSSDRCRVMPKSDPQQHEGYMRLVRQMPCAGCGIEGYSQFAHSDAGKGLAIKSDCREGWPGCGPRPGVNGCHYDVGTSGFLGREGRRKFEAEAAQRTRADIRRRGLWPVGLAEWPED